ncbi:tyrosine-type recombinase/integrase [Cytobacillus firmus]|uniref:tyrosine-type recombinase/integrase n=1 Tax=Cytobacillus firmus TaxID=1399 RepID=UPI00237B7CF6|nr:tyrosine-type recombinase/integrase [Cytobacillus firmus]MDD9313141.1 tyrosine-type recombinase/integrase [Cytobacillus firmus]
MKKKRPLGTLESRGELLGLEWSHIDLEKGIVQIKQIITRSSGGRPILKGPKSRNSIRVISLPPMMVEEQKKYHIHWKKEKMRMRDMWIEHEHEFVFCNENGKHYYPTTHTTWWKRFAERSGVRFIRLHDLRQTKVDPIVKTLI